MFRPSTRILKKFRFLLGTDVVDGLISSKDLCQLLWVATSASTGTLITTNVLLKKVEIWQINDVSYQLDFASISLTWLPVLSTISVPPVTVSDTGNAMRPAHIVTTPPKYSSDFAWMQGWGNRAIGPFIVTANAGAVMDLTVETYLVDRSLDTWNSGVPTTNALTCVGATAGNLYFNQLDNSSTTLAVAGPSYWAPVAGMPVLNAFS